MPSELGTGSDGENSPGPGERACVGVFSADTLGRPAPSRTTIGWIPNEQQPPAMVMNPGQRRPSGDHSDPELLVYEVVAFRRMQYDGMMWQVPTLSLTAQAFLLTIALGPDSRPAARIISGLLSAVIALISVQLMSKHRRHEEADSRWLEKFEQDRGLEPVHARPLARAESVGMRPPSRLEGWPSFDVWRLGLTVFGAVAVLAAGAAAIEPGLFG